MKRFATFTILLSLFSLPFCTTSKKAIGGQGKEMPASVVSYTTDVAPILQNRCSPCHFPDGGKVKFLDTHSAVVENIDAILYRVQLPRDSTAFMPFKGKNEPLSDSLINVLKTWKMQGSVK